MSAQRSLHNVNLTIGGFPIPVRVEAVSKEFSISTKEACRVHGKAVDYDQRCGACRHRITAPVAGTPAPRQLKQRFCTNQACGSKLGKVKDDVKSQPYCDECERILKDEEVADAYPFADKLILVSEKERTALLALRRGRGIQIVQSLDINQHPSLIYYRGPVMQLKPNLKADKHAHLLFDAFRAGARRQAITFAAYSVLEQEEKHITFVHEHGALVRCETNGLVTLVPLHGEHEVEAQVVPAYVPENQEERELLELLTKDIGLLQRAFKRRGKTINLRELLSTPGSRALRKLIHAKFLNAPCSLEEPAPADRKVARIVRRLERVRQTLAARAA